MAQIKDKFATELRAIVTKLEALLDEFDDDGSAIALSPEVLKKISEFKAAGKCLQCEKVKKEPYRRGLCAACYKRTKGAVSAGTANYPELTRDGLILQKHAGGRGPEEETLLDKFLARKVANDKPESSTGGERKGPAKSALDAARALDEKGKKSPEKSTSS